MHFWNKVKLTILFQPKYGLRPLLHLLNPPLSIQLHPLQVENCDSNSRLVVDEDDNDKFRLERVKPGLNTVIIEIDKSINIVAARLVRDCKSPPCDLGCNPDYP